VKPPLPAGLRSRSTIMAEPLKNYYGPDVPARIARMIKNVDIAFDEDAFLADALDGYQALDYAACLADSACAWSPLAAGLRARD
jgi:hypothetical protein